MSTTATTRISPKANLKLLDTKIIFIEVDEKSTCTAQPWDDFKFLYHMLLFNGLHKYFIILENLLVLNCFIQAYKQNSYKKS